jgi:hypothetical protein
MKDERRCDQCGDDGWIDLFDEEGNVNGAEDCPWLDQPWHRPFNASGLMEKLKGD